MAKKGAKKASLGKVGRVEREQRLNSTLVIGAIIVFSSIFIIIIGGIILNTFVYPNQPIAIIEDVELLTKDFQDRVIIERTNLVNEYYSYLNYISQLGMDQIPTDLYERMNNIEFELIPSIIGSNVLNQMSDEIIIKIEAQANGIIVSDEEIEEKFQEALGYFPDGTATPTITQIPWKTSTLSPTQIALVSITPSNTPTTEATETPSTQNYTQEPTPPISTSIPLEPSPTPTTYTYESYLELREQYIEDYWSIFEAQIYKEKVIETMVADIPNEEPWVWARHILVEEENTALEVLNKLEEGADWTELAIEYSTGPSAERGGDLGWFDEGTMVPEFSEVAFNLAIGETSNPIQSDFGWHIIQIIGKEMRSISPERISILNEEAFKIWLAEIRETKEIELMDYWQERIPTEPDIPPEYRLSQSPPQPTIKP